MIKHHFFHKLAFKSLPMKQILFACWLVMYLPLCSYGNTGNFPLKTEFPSNSFRDTVIETATRYGNGTVQLRTISYVDQEGINYKVIKEKYRKNGSKKYVFVLDYGVTILYHAQYDKSNKLRVEKIYSYNFKNTLVQIETKKDGVSTFQSFGTDIYGD